MYISPKKFAVQVGIELEPRLQLALERLMLRDWVRLIDITTIAARFGIFRIFRVMPPAVAWYDEFSKLVNR